MPPDAHNVPLKPTRKAKERDPVTTDLVERMVAIQRRKAR